jgi:ABC-2 type transport system ATP-binding protein
MLQALQLSKQYGDYEALHELSLSIGAGDVFCLLGANGAGKSTTINLFLNFIQPSSGQALVNGIDVKTAPLQARKQLAYIPEVVMLYPQLTGLENLNFFSRLSGFSYRHEQLNAFLLDAGLQQDAIDRRLGGYSKGMRQKVGIAIAIAKRAAALIMDEPTSGLDPRAVEEFSTQVKKFAMQGGAVLMATHDIFNAVAIGTHIGIMKRGHLLHVMPAAAVSASDLQKIYLETIQ